MMPQFYHKLAILLESIACLVCFVAVCHLSYRAWWNLSNGFDGWRVCVYAAPVFLLACLALGYSVWRSIRKSSKK